MQVNTLILGAGAAGMFCAAQAGPGTIVIDHARAPGEKIRISGGGRCNFTNLHAGPEAFLSRNPHFCKSALSRYTQWDFIALVERHRITWHEKTLGQLFCDDRSTRIVDMLRDEMARAGAELWLSTELAEIGHDGSAFTARLRREGREVTVRARNLVLATGGKSIPKMGASGLAYDIALQFGLEVTPTPPALVPLTFPEGRFAPISGVATPAAVRAGAGRFEEALLFTHRGLSGPAVLQASSYWEEGRDIEIDLAPGRDLGAWLRQAKRAGGRRQLASVLGDLLPNRLVAHLAEADWSAPLAGQSDARLTEVGAALNRWTLRPGGTEGYRTAEVTLGGIATAGLSSRTLEARSLPGLYAIGEAVDVTGWLGGYNFQWAWSSAHAAGTAIRTG